MDEFAEENKQLGDGLYAFNVDGSGGIFAVQPQAVQAAPAAAAARRTWVPHGDAPDA